MSMKLGVSLVLVGFANWISKGYQKLYLLNSWYKIMLSIISNKQSISGITKSSSCKIFCQTTPPVKILLGFYYLKLFLYRINSTQLASEEHFIVLLNLLICACTQNVSCLRHCGRDVRRIKAKLNVGWLSLTVSSLYP